MLLKYTYKQQCSDSEIARIRAAPRCYFRNLLKYACYSLETRIGNVKKNIT